MSYALKRDPLGQYIEVTLDGEITLSEVEVARDEAYIVCRHEHIRRMLVDVRHVQVHLTTLDLYSLASDLAGRQSLPGMHYVIVVGQDSPNMDLFGQVARRRGIRVETFTAYDKALVELLDHGRT
jgi:hypothetical protein